jgi:hypothetical protein
VTVKKTMLSALVVAGAFGLAGTAAAAPLVTVKDPTPDQQFSGTYQCGWEMEPDPDNPGQYRYKLDSSGNRIPVRAASASVSK